MGDITTGTGNKCKTVMRLKTGGFEKQMRKINIIGHDIDATSM